MALATAEDVVGFWREAGSERWFERDDAFDSAIRARFLATHEAAGRGDLDAWQDTPEGALALVLLLDQFPRNLFRGSPRTYATDSLARRVADHALARGFHTIVESDLAAFFYVPFMHSEQLADQERCVALYAAADDADGLKWARHHRDIVDRFGRFPHRNALLGRKTTEEETAFLKDGGFGGSALW